MSVIQLFEPKHADFLIGPFEEYKVVIDGRAIPKLSAQKLESGQLNLVLDHRFCVCLDANIAQSVAWMVANALAIGQGYAHAGSENRDRPFAPISMSVGSVELESHP